MNKKLKFVIALMSLLLLTALLIACNPTAHVHTWSTTWDKDGEHHWHNCTADGCDVTDNAQKDGYAVHDFTNGNCICGQPEPHAHQWSNAWDKDGVYHWHNCTADSCDVTDNAQKDGYAKHDFTNGNCICGQPKPHAHQWSNAWDKNGIYHWHNCTANGCDITDNAQKDGYAKHDFTNGDCACGQPKPTEGLAYTLNPDGESYSVTGSEKSAETVVIAAEYKGKPVTGIGHEAFDGCASLVSIVIPDGVTSISWRAFFQCSSLESITIPDGVTSIGELAFYDCVKLTSISIPDSITSIEVDAFKHCGALQYNEFDNAYYLGNDGNPYLFLISAKSKEITSCTINQKTKAIYIDAFGGCASLENIRIPDSVSIIHESAFYNCSGIVSISIPDGVTRIEDSTFSGCTSLVSINIPEGVTRIGRSAFEGCTSLTSVTVPDSISSIGSDAFYDCTDLQFNEHDNALYLGNSGNPFLALIRARSEHISYCAIYPKTKLIADAAFESCSFLQSITIPDSVISIGENAFSACSEFSKIIIGSGVKSIGVSAFWGDNSLTSITIPDNVTSLGSIAFSQCGYLTNIILGNGLTSIDDSTFASCGRLKSIVIPDGVTSIGRSAFSGCSSLASVTIPDSVTVIEQRAFYGCTDLVTINFNGTMAQWKELIKKLEWNTDTGDFIVHCTDGDLDKGCTEI